MRMKTRKRVSATLLAFVLAVSAAGITPAETGGGIEHTHDGACGYKAGVPCGHTTHDENCGYAEATEGSACSHEHDEGCYRQVINCQHIHMDECYEDASEASPSNTAEPENCPHICSEEDGCITKELDCPHIHDRECGYVPAADGQPCKHEQGEHDDTCGYVPAAPCNVLAGSRQMRGILQKTNEQPSAEKLLTDAECIVTSETANTLQDVTNWINMTWLLGIEGLDAALESGYGAGIMDLQIVPLVDAFTAAEDGTVQNPDGAAGHFTFSVVVPGVDGVTEPQLTVQKTCTITPKPYMPVTEEASFSGSVRTINGTPVAGRQVRITAVEGGAPVAEGMTKEDGSYDVALLQDGQYKVAIEGVAADPSLIEKRGSEISGSGNFWFPIANISGAASTEVSTSGDGKATIEWVSWGDTGGSAGLSAEKYTPTDGDFNVAAGLYSPGAVVAMKEEVEVSPDKVIIEEKNFNWNGSDYWVGDIIVANGIDFLIKSLTSEEAYLVLLSTGGVEIHKYGGGFLGASTSESYVIDKENRIISINEAEYYVGYSLESDDKFEIIYFLYVPGSDGKMVAAGSYTTDQNGKIISVTFNEGYTPTDILAKQSYTQPTYIAPNRGMFHVNPAFAANINLTNNRTRQSGSKGTLAISGLEGVEESVALHYNDSTNTYDRLSYDPANKVHYLPTESLSPFMIFTFDEIDTEIPVKTILTDSGDGGGDHDSSSDGDSSSGSSTYNPDILRGTWVRTDAGTWMFRMINGSYARSRWGLVDGLWYYFDNEGKMLTGWQFLNNRWYYLCTEETSKLAAGRKEGTMLTGWYYDPAYQGWFYLDAGGAMVTGWKEIGGKWYYFYGNGVMAADTEADGYKLGPDGARKEQERGI